MDPDPSSWIQTVSLILVAFFLVGLNAFFVASEFAIVKVRRTRLEELAGQGVQAARISILCVDQLDEYLSATQLGITLVSLALGWIGEESFYNLFVLMFPDYLSVGTGWYHAAATAAAFFVITLLHVVLGELVPKSMAIQKAELITLKVSRPLHWFYVGAKPLIRSFTFLANIILRRIGYPGLEEPPLSEEELKLVMRESHEDGVISASEAQIITRAFEFSDKRAADIMIPVDKVDYLSLDRPYEENMRAAKRKMHTRFPLIAKDWSQIQGVVHMKDVLHAISENEPESNELFTKLARPPVFVDMGTRQDQLMKVLKERRAHLAIVRNPKDTSHVGIVTMEDILEELVGDIRDEHGN